MLHSIASHAHSSCTVYLRFLLDSQSQPPTHTLTAHHPRPAHPTSGVLHRIVISYAQLGQEIAQT